MRDEEKEDIPVLLLSPPPVAGRHWTTEHRISQLYTTSTLQLSFSLHQYFLPFSTWDFRHLLKMPIPPLIEV